jgi:AcrR family transcriptional regulator
MQSESAANTMPSPRVQKKRKQARTEILQTALSILREQGVESVTLASVAGRLGLTKQAIYHYFRSKDVLMRALFTSLLNDEVEVLISAVKNAASGPAALGTLIRQFYRHYIDNLEAFRTVYCLSQLNSAARVAMDETTIREEINPRTHKLFDVLEARLSEESMSPQQRQRARQLAFVAWTSALGLVTMLSVAESARDPLVHSDEALLDALTHVFESADPQF